MIIETDGLKNSSSAYYNTAQLAEKNGARLSDTYSSSSFGNVTNEEEPNFCNCFGKITNDDTSSITSTGSSNNKFKMILRKLSNNSKYTRCSFYRNNLPFFVLILCYLILNVILTVVQYHIYTEQNKAVIVARIGGILLDFNSAVIILLVMRRLVTWLRNSLFGRFLPTDDFIKFHKFIGVFILLMSLMHTIAHCINLYWLSAEYKSALKKAVQTTSTPINITSSTVTSTQIPNMTSIMTSLTSSITTIVTSSPTSIFNMTSTNNSIIVRALSHRKPVPPPDATYAELLFTTKSKIGWVGAAAMPTGWALWIVLAIIEVFSLPFIRRKGYFQVFYITHWFHVFYYILLILHCKNFWKWFIGPLVLVVFERIYNYLRVKSVKHGETYIKDVNLLSSKVTQLIITRPPNFKFKSGDYIYVKIPQIAKFEWHPFTISSAPERQDELWLHIRTLGNWTNKLYDYFQDMSKEKGGAFQNFASPTKYERKMSNMIVMTNYKKKDLLDRYENPSKKRIKDLNRSYDDIKKIETNLNISNNIKNVWMDIYLDGPYSTSTRRILDSEQAILIAGGIGVTPFASILQSLWFKYSKSLKTCNKCNHQWYDILDQKKLKRVDFIWVNRNYESFEWFIELLGQIELQQLNSTQESERFIGIHLFMTSSKVVQEIKPLENPGFDMEGQIKSKLDDFSIKLTPGRPDFDKIFADIYSNKKGKVDVFFCGNREFGRQVQKKSISFKFKFHKEHF